MTTTLIANTLVNNLITVLITAIAISLFQGNGGVSLAIGCATILVLVFGEITPKAIALVYSDEIALLVSYVFLFLITIFKPLVFIFTGLTKPFLFLCGIRPEDKTSNVTEEDLKTFFEETEQLGQISGYERSIMQKILTYTDIQAKHIMTPRPEIKAISIDSSIADILELSEVSHFSRFPVYEDDIDNIKGIFYIKDFLFSPFFRKNQHEFNVGHYLREPIFVFETTSSIQLRQQLSDASQNMLIVLDEYGGTAGVITTEDLTEAVFGNIEDEYDLKTSNDCIKVKGGFLVRGTMSIFDFNETFHTNFSDIKYETVAGLILEKVGDVPKKGSTIQIDDFNFHIIEASQTKLKKIKVSVAGEK